MTDRSGDGQERSPEGEAARMERRPLDGIRVLELGQVLAGPLAASILAWYGAEVIKVEPPSGDPIRSWRVLENGTSLWWRSLARNKHLVAIDLKTKAGQGLVRRLALECDVLVENFRPGTLERWGLDPEELRREKPELIVARVSGYGQTGPYRERRGFASVCEAFGGLRHITGHPGEPPVRSNASLGDSLAAFHTVIGVLLALLRRERAAGSASGETIDVAIYESVLTVMEAALTEQDRLGIQREPSGTTITGVVPTDAYPCADGRRVVIGANSDGIYRRLMQAAGRADLAADPRLATNDLRVSHRAELDAAIASWTATLSSREVVERLEAAGVPAAPIQTTADILADRHVAERGVLETLDFDGRPLRLPALGPRLAEAPGRTDWIGGEIGERTTRVLGDLLGLDDAELDRLRRERVIA